VASFVWHFYKTVMFKLMFAFMLNLIELEHRQTTPKLARKQEQATGINGDSTRTTDSYKEKVEKTKEQS